MSIFRRSIMASCCAKEKQADMEANFTLRFMESAPCNQFMPNTVPGERGIGFSFYEEDYAESMGIYTSAYTWFEDLKEIIVTIKEQTSQKVVYYNTFTSIPRKIVIGYNTLGGIQHCTDKVELIDDYYNVSVKVFLNSKSTDYNFTEQLVIADYLYTYKSTNSKGETITTSDYLNCLDKVNYTSGDDVIILLSNWSSF